MRLATASLTKHKDGANTTITCGLHNFCRRMFVNPFVAGSVSERLVELEGMVADER